MTIAMAIEPEWIVDIAEVFTTRLLRNYEEI